MLYSLQGNKEAIKNLTVFNGLAVDNPEKYRSLFLRPDHHLIEVWGKKGLAGYVIFQIIHEKLIFKLINVSGGMEVTKTLHDRFLIPYCVKNGLNKVVANVERRGMAKKLKELGFKKIKGSKNQFMKEVPYVLQ